MSVELKEDIKKRLGKSPDRADAFVMGQYAVQLIAGGEYAKTAPGVRWKAPDDAPEAIADWRTYAGREAARQRNEEVEEDAIA